MPFAAVLDELSDIATILTGIIAVTAGIYVMGRGIRHRRRLERHLKAAKEFDRKINRPGRRTPLRLSAELAMTVPEILAAANSSKKIKSSPGFFPRGWFAAVVLLEYEE